MNVMDILVQLMMIHLVLLYIIIIIKIIHGMQQIQVQYFDHIILDVKDHQKDYVIKHYQEFNQLQFVDLDVDIKFVFNLEHLIQN